ncbi:MAG: DUF58 domain-containing protein, partial [Vulcanimicrobiota bacterium]
MAKPDQKQFDFFNLYQRSYLFRKLMNWKYAYTVMGRYLLIIGAISAIISGLLINVSILFYSLFFFCVFLYFLSPFISRFFLPRVDLKVKLPTRVEAGAEVTQTVEVINKGNKDTVQFFVREEFIPRGIETPHRDGILIPFLENNASITLEQKLVVKKRGFYRLKQLVVETAFPLGVFKVGNRIKRERDLLAYPRFNPVIKFDIPSGRKLQPGGIALASKTGDSMEFLGTREFRTGDDPRHIHWKSWARLNEPI